MNKEIKKGFGYGLLATLAMTILMLITVVTKVSPTPMPIPAALAKLVLGSAPKPLLLGSGMLFHFLYGGIAGIVFVLLFKKINYLTTLSFAGILWLILQVVFLPLLGWGFFGANITPKIAVATLILHAIYGTTLGWLFIRNSKK